MPRAKNRLRTCQYCQKEYVLGVDSTQHKYCSETCRSSFHYNRWKSNGGLRCKHKNLAYRLKHHYKITIEERDELLKQQNFSCAICKTDTPTKYGWHIDHCHATGKVRGLLCQFCNQILGMTKENTETLQKAIEYLEQHR